jgi:MFS family permease
VALASGGSHTHDRLTARELLTDARFRLVLPAVLVTPLVLTALFLYQAVLGASKGWSPAWLATAFTGYAVARASASLLVGPLIDRWSAHTLLPVYLLPLAAGLGVLALGGPAWMALVYLALVGISTGASSSVLAALWAEMYGPSQVAAVRSLTSGFTIVATAVSPAVFGLLLERGVGAAAIQYGGLVLVLLAAVLGHVAVRARTADVASPGTSVDSRKVA